MHDWQKLLNARKILNGMAELGKSGSVYFHYLLVGKNIEVEVAKGLGLVVGAHAKGTVKPL